MLIRTRARSWHAFSLRAPVGGWGLMGQSRLSPRTPSVDRPQADRLFAGIDHRRVEAGARSWIAVVLGIHANDTDLWIQVATQDNPSNSVVLRLSRWATVDHALNALRTCAITDETQPRIIPVMQIV